MTSGHDIKIGEKEYIKWIDFDPRYDPVLDIDDLVQPLALFFDAMEAECFKDCCGIHAYSFEPEIIKAAGQKGNRNELLLAIGFAIEEIKEANAHIVCSSHLNQLFDRTVFLKLLYHLERHV